MLYYKPGDLRLRPNEHGEHIIEQCGTVTETLSSEKKAVARFNRIREELEKTLPPPPQVSEEERRGTAGEVSGRQSDPRDLIERERTQEAVEFSKIWVKRKPGGRRGCNASV